MVNRNMSNRFSQSVIMIKDERDVVEALYHYYKSVGYYAVKELQLTRKVLNIKEITKGACSSVVRIDLCLVDPNLENIVFIEAENGLWVKHPTQYIGFANYIYLACPNIKESTIDNQLEFAEQAGIGVITVGLSEEKRGVVQIRELLQGKRFQVSPYVKTVVLKMIERRLSREKKVLKRFLAKKEGKIFV